MHQVLKFDMSLSAPSVDNSTQHVLPEPHLTVQLWNHFGDMSGPKAPAEHFTLLYFAASTSFTQKEHDFFPAPMPVSALFDKLDEKYPGIKQKVLLSSAVTVNLDYVDLEEEATKGSEGLSIQSGDEVAIIPPVSSG